MGSMLLKLARAAERAEQRKNTKKRPKKRRTPSMEEGLRTAYAGRLQVAKHKRPSLKQAIQTVLGTQEEMTSMEIIAELRARHWLPLGDAEQNVRWALCVLAKDEEVKRVRRGVYRGVITSP